MIRVHHTNGASEKVVLTSISGRVYIITLNRPKALNAINDQLTSELKQAMMRRRMTIKKRKRRTSQIKIIRLNGKLKHYVDEQK